MRSILWLKKPLWTLLPDKLIVSFLKSITEPCNFSKKKLPAHRISDKTCVGSNAILI